jgi:hypothetical protein
MQTKTDEYGTRYLWKIRYMSWDPTVGECVDRLWAYDRYHAEERFAAGLEEFELENTEILEVSIA